jgi:hypothetical protein
MQSAKRMVLMDERWVEQLCKRPDWQKPIDEKAKGNLHHEMQNDLNENIADDVKTKQYNQHLGRFLATNRELSDVQVEPPVKKKRVTKRNSPLSSSLSQKRVKRVTKPPKKILWDEW